MVGTSDLPLAGSFLRAREEQERKASSQWWQSWHGSTCVVAQQHSSFVLSGLACVKLEPLAWAIHESMKWESSGSLVWEDHRVSTRRSPPCSGRTALWDSFPDLWTGTEGNSSIHAFLTSLVVLLSHLTTLVTVPPCESMGDWVRRSKQRILEVQSQQSLAAMALPSVALPLSACSHWALER